MAARNRAEAGQDLDLVELGRRVREERVRRGVSLDGLSARARVSRSMISEVERGTKAATVLVLDRIATGLGTSLARLVSREARARVIVLRHEDQVVARDQSGWERRILSPVLPGVEFEFMRTTLGPGVDAGTFCRMRRDRASMWPWSTARCCWPSTGTPTRFGRGQHLL